MAKEGIGRPYVAFYKETRVVYCRAFFDRRSADGLEVLCFNLGAPAVVVVRRVYEDVVENFSLISLIWVRIYFAWIRAWAFRKAE